YQMAQGNDSQRGTLAAHGGALIVGERHFETRVEVEEEFEMMRAVAGELVFDRPITFALVEGDDTAMNQRFRQTRVGVMFGVECVARRIAMPLVDSRADVFKEREQ